MAEDYRIQLTATEGAWAGDEAFAELTAKIITRNKKIPIPQNQYVVFDPGGHRRIINARGNATLLIKTTATRIIKYVASLESDADVTDEVNVVIPQKPKGKTPEEIQATKDDAQLKSSEVSSKIKKLEAEERIGHLKTQIEERKLGLELLNVETIARKFAELEIQKAELELEKFKLQVSEMEARLQKDPEVQRRAELENRKVELDIAEREKKINEKVSEAKLKAEEDKARAESAEAEKKIREANKDILKPDIALVNLSRSHESVTVSVFRIGDDEGKTKTLCFTDAEHGGDTMNSDFGESGVAKAIFKFGESKRREILFLAGYPNSIKAIDIPARTSPISVGEKIEEAIIVSTSSFERGRSLANKLFGKK